MTATPPPAPSAPAGRLVEAYLTDVRAALAGLDAGEREEVVLMVTEHIDAALAQRPGATAHDVAEVLAALGPPHRFAEGTSLPGADRVAGPPVPAPEPPASSWSTAAVVGAAVAFPLFVVQPLVAVALMVACLVLGLLGARSSTGTERRRYRWAAGLGGAGLLLVVALLAGTLAVGPPASDSGPVVEMPAEEVPAP